MTRPTLITVKGQFLRVDGTPEVGTLEFQSKVYTLYSHASKAIVPSRIRTALDSQGNFEIIVPATNDPDWAPVGWTYTLVIKLKEDYSIYEVSVPYDADNAELSLGELIPVQGSTGIVPGNFAPLVHTHAAEQIVNGTIALARLPVGTTASTVARGDHTHEGQGSSGPVDIEDVTGLTAALNSKANTSSLAAVATSGSYNDLTDKPAAGAVSSVAGRTGAVVLTKSDVGLSNVDNTSDTNKPISSATQTALNAKANTAHTHTVSDVSNLQSALDGKALTIHTHSIANVTNLQDSLDAKADELHNHAIADVTNLQTTLDGKAATVHTHAIADTSGLQGALDAKAGTAHTHDDLVTDSDLTSALEDKSDVGHSHAVSDVTNLQSSLDAKASASHTHTIADTSGLQTALDSKASSSHNHTVSDVTGLQTSLDGKAAATHTHAISDTTGLQTALDGKAASSHNHAISDVTNLQTTLNGKAPAIMVWNGSSYVASTTAQIFVGPNDPGTMPDGSLWIDTDA